MKLRPLLLVVLALAPGCGSDDSDESSGETNSVDVVASDFRFDPSSVSVDTAGRTTFRLTNEGGTTHALELEGNGIEEETDEIGPGESAELTIDLEDGEYELYCPVGNHRELGMEGRLVVGGGAVGGIPTTTDETATTDDDGATTDDYP